MSGKKDLYEYWKSDIARCLLHDVQDNGTAKETSDGFLVVNVASQEVKPRFRERSRPVSTFRWNCAYPVLCSPEACREG